MLKLLIKLFMLIGLPMAFVSILLAKILDKIVDLIYDAGKSALEAYKCGCDGLD